MYAMNFELPPTGTEQSPAFVDATTCKEWLLTVPLANAIQAQSMFLRQLGLLHRFTLPPDDRLAILETLRQPLIDVQEETANKFAGKPLPLAPPEQAAMETTLTVWHELALGYLRCFDDACSGDSSISALAGLRTQFAGNPELVSKAAKLSQRILAIFADWQLDLNRGGQVPDGDYWQKLHEIIFAAETLGIAAHAVSDRVRHGVAATSPLAAYAECNLLATANVYELPARHLVWVARWAKRWGVKLTLLALPPEDIRNRAVPLSVDLDSDHPASVVPNPSGGSRWLETTELRKSIVTRIALLEQGRAPADLQLGDDVTQPAAGQLLQRLLQRWCKGGAQRSQERHDMNIACSMVVGLEVAHFELSGRTVFRAPTRSDSVLRREREEFETFGNLSHRTTAAEKNVSQIESWRLVDQSTSGLRATRPLKEGVRVGSGAVVAAKIADDRNFVLGNVRWIFRDSDLSLVAGIQLFRGEARPAAMRILDSDGAHSGWRQCFLLPESKALHEPASIILPAGTFRLDRKIEVMIDQQLQMLKLFRVLDRGIEFERCNFYD